VLEYSSRAWGVKKQRFKLVPVGMKLQELKNLVVVKEARRELIMRASSNSCILCYDPHVLSKILAG